MPALRVCPSECKHCAAYVRTLKWDRFRLTYWHWSGTEERMPSLMCLICPICLQPFFPRQAYLWGAAALPRMALEMARISGLAIYLSQDLALMAGGGDGNVWMPGERRCCVLPCPSYHMPPQQVRLQIHPSSEH